MKAKKLITLLLCAALLVTCTVMGTLAYLSDTKTVKNTFTVGNVKIDLTEGKTTAYGEWADANGDAIPAGSTDVAPRVYANEYKLIPGHTYNKDPKITVKEGSEACYLFVVLDNGLYGLLPENCIENQMEANDWTYDREHGIWYLENPIPASDEDQVFNVFESFTVLRGATGTDIAGYAESEIVITAYAVQADGFDSALAAWNGFWKTNTNTP